MAGRPRRDRPSVCQHGNDGIADDSALASRIERHRPPAMTNGLAIAENAYSIRCMAGLYEVELEPEVRSWLGGLTDRDFGRVYFLVGFLAEHAEDLGEP